jgi:GT2 family glycosyltransferase
MTEVKKRYSTLIVMPCLNQAEYTKKALDSLFLTEDEALLVIDNNSTDNTQEIIAEANKKREIFATKNDMNMGAAGSWNTGLELGFNDLHVSKIIILNNDILLKKHTIVNIKRDLDNPEIGIATARNVSGEVADEKAFFALPESHTVVFKETPDFSCFGISQACFEQVSYFDEAFYPAYFEDNDYHYRMGLAGIKAVCNYGNPYWHYGSRTKQANPEIDGYIRYCYAQNREYFITKWGGEPGEETYKIPFDGTDYERKDAITFDTYLERKKGAIS